MRIFSQSVSIYRWLSDPNQVQKWTKLTTDLQGCLKLQKDGLAEEDLPGFDTEAPHLCLCHLDYLPRATSSYWSIRETTLSFSISKHYFQWCHSSTCNTQHHKVRQHETIIKYPFFHPRDKTHSAESHDNLKIWWYVGVMFGSLELSLSCTQETHCWDYESSLHLQH